MDDVTFQEFLEELDLKLGSDANSSFLWEDDLAKPQPDFNLNKFEDGHSQGLFENHMIGGTEGGNNIFNICGDGDVNFPEVNFPNEKPVDSLDTHPENLQLPLLVEENDISTTRYENDFAYSDFQVFQEQFVPRDFHDLGCREPVHLQDKVTLSQKETDAEGHFANFFEKDEHLPVPPLTGSNPPSDTTIPWTHSSPSVSYGQEMPKCSKSKDLKHNSKILESKSSEDDGAAKKLQRLIRNRASASESRMRRKSYVADLENKCKSLESQLNSLRQIASISAMENGLLRDQLLRMQQLFPAAVINGSSIKSSAGFLQHQSAETGKINGKNVPPESEVSEEGNGRLAEPAALESDSLPLESLPLLFQSHQPIILLDLPFSLLILSLIFLSLFPESHYPQLELKESSHVPSEERGNDKFCFWLGWLLLCEVKNSVVSSRSLSFWKLVLSWMPCRSFD